MCLPLILLHHFTSNSYLSVGSVFFVLRWGGGGGGYVIVISQVVVVNVFQLVLGILGIWNNSKYHVQLMMRLFVYNTGHIRVLLVWLMHHT